MGKTGIVLHWSAGCYQPNAIDRKDYHGVVTWDGEKAEYRKMNDYTMDLPHTWHRNTDNIGLAVCAMAEATEFDFGECPLRPEQVKELCIAAAEVAFLKKIHVENIKTHAECAMADGYGIHSGDPETRWDLARITPGQLDTLSPALMGTHLRKEIRGYLKEIKDAKRFVRPLHSETKYLGK